VTTKKVKEEKTNAMRLLEVNNVVYRSHEYDPEKAISALEVAKSLNENPEQVFKTLVTTSKSKNHYVFVIPGNAELDLKKAAKAAGEKFIELIPQRELLPLTGYIHGGCSPIGMKKQFATFINETALLFDSIIISGGRIGFQVELNPNDLAALIQANFYDLTA
jgi:hypothetical protein